jgi:hypothetical protein
MRSLEAWFRSTNAAAAIGTAAPRWMGKQYRETTKEEDLDVAKEWAEDWYFGLRGKARAGLLKTEKTFGKAADQFEKEYEIITEGQRGPRWIEGHKIRLRLHLRPFFGELDARKGAGVSDAPGDDIIDRQSSRPLHAPR